MTPNYSLSGRIAAQNDTSFIVNVQLRTRFPPLILQSDLYDPIPSETTFPCVRRLFSLFNIS